MDQQAMLQHGHRCIIRFVKRHLLGPNETFMAIQECSNMLNAQGMNALTTYGSSVHFRYDFFLQMEMAVARYCKYLH